MFPSLHYCYMSCMQVDAQIGCEAGYVHNQEGECVPCPAGSFKALDSDDVCVPCFPGTVSKSASTYCSVCISGSYEDQLTECRSCPVGLNTWLPGSSGVESCINEEEQNKRLAVSLQHSRMRITVLILYYLLYV